MDYNNLTKEQLILLLQGQITKFDINQFIKLLQGVEYGGYNKFNDVEQLINLLSLLDHKLYIIRYSRYYDEKFSILDYTTNKLYRSTFGYEPVIDIFDIPIEENILQKFDIKKARESYYKITNTLFYDETYNNNRIIPRNLEFLFNQDNIVFIDAYLLDKYLIKQFLSFESVN